MSENFFPAAHHEVWLYDPFGVRLLNLSQLVSINYSKALGSIGRFVLLMPFTEELFNLVGIDFLIGIARNSQNTKVETNFLGLIRSIRILDKGGFDLLELGGEDGISLLNSRIVAYQAGTAQARKTDQADDMMKAIVRENLGALATDTARNLTSYGFEVEVDEALGPTITRVLTWKNILTLLNAIYRTSVRKGTPVYFDIVPVQNSETSIGFKFVTAINQLGNDRTFTSGAPTVFSREFGNLENPSLAYDHAKEINAVYAAGEGWGIHRQLLISLDDDRIGISPWNRREKFIDVRQAETAEDMSTKADEALKEGQPQVLFSAILKDAPASRYGVEWNYGDKVVVQYRNVNLNGIINAVKITWSEDGSERIESRVEAVL